MRSQKMLERRDAQLHVPVGRRIGNAVRAADVELQTGQRFVAGDLEARIIEDVLPGLASLGGLPGRKIRGAELAASVQFQAQGRADLRIPLGAVRRDELNI